MTTNAAPRRSRVAAHRTPWLASLLGVLGAAEMLMALSAPATTMVIGVVGGVALVACPWSAARSRPLAWALLAVGVLPFTVLTYWAIVPVVLALLALAICIPLLIHTAPRSPS